MSEFQSYLDDLRSGKLLSAVDIVPAILRKYSTIYSKHHPEDNPNEILNVDNSLSFLIFELCKTDISQEDLDRIAFLSAYFAYLNYNGSYIYHYHMLFMQACQRALLIRDRAKNACLLDREFDKECNLEAFLSAEDPFSVMVSSCQDQCENPSEVKDEGQQMDIIFDAFGLATRRQFNNFQKDVYRRMKEHGEFTHCPLIEAECKNRKFQSINMKLKKTITNYGEYLKKKLEAQGIKVDYDKLSQADEVLSDETLKLLKRYETIVNLDIDGLNLMNIDDVKKVQNAINQCREHRMTWHERNLLQRILDVLSFGIYPLVRFLTSNERQMIRKSDNLLHDIDGLILEVPEDPRV